MFPMRLLALVLSVAAGCGNNEPTKAREPGGDEPGHLLAGEGPRCVADDDCVVACDQRGDCCGEGPVCTMVQHRATAAANAAHNRKHCTDADRAGCNDVGTMRHRPPIPTPRCRAGVCVGELAPSERVDASGFDRTCKTADDCHVVDDLPCNPCNCSSVSIALSEVGRFTAAAKAVTCGPPPNIDCGECRSFLPTCDDGTCGSRLE
jgi:hypothetical protein